MVLRMTDGKRLWVVGRSANPFGDDNDWEFVGVFDTVHAAVAACASDDFVGPALLNEAIQEKREVWPGAWYPAYEVAPPESGYDDPSDTLSVGKPKAPRKGGVRK